VSVALIGGTGEQGRGLAARWALAGIEVVIGSRSKERARRAAEEVSTMTGKKVLGLMNPDAAERAEIIILTIPFRGVEAIMKTLKKELEEKKIISPIVPPRDYRKSAAEKIRELAPKSASVASAFHNVGAHALLDLSKPVECDVVVCGEGEAKRAAMELAEKIPGIRALDGGSLENSRITEALTHLIIQLNKKYGKKAIGIKFTGIS